MLQWVGQGVGKKCETDQVKESPVGPQLDEFNDGHRVHSPVAGEGGKKIQLVIFPYAR